MERLQKILARGGIASRRAAEQLILAGRVRVNGKIVTELGAKADERRDRVEVDGKRVVAEDFVYVVLHKPRGVVSTMSDPEGRPTVRELLAPLGARIYPIGRLDFATSGVLLATNDGAFAEALLHPRKAVPKTYVVKVKGALTDKDLDRWRKGVPLEDGMTLPAEVRNVRHEDDKTWFELTIREGRNQQIRRMGEATGFPVMRLARLAFAGISGEGLRPGHYRSLTRDELITMKKTFGVPRSVSAAPVEPTRGRSARTVRPLGTKSASREGSPRDGGPRKAGRAGATARRTDREGAGAAPRTHGARYGGGSPGRRSVETTEDWGGGAGRGSSGGRYASDAREDRPKSELGGGRLGRTRTTGTSGGVGARGPAERVKGRRTRS